MSKIMTEQERQDRFVTAVGGTARAEELDRIYRNSYPHGTEYDRLMGRGLTLEQAFRIRASRAGFSTKQINIYLSL